MPSTPLHLKPVFYGSELADNAFISVVVLHAVVAAIAVVSGIVALIAKKGGRVHVRAGGAFVWTMIVTALSGALLGAIRLSFFYEENHTDYIDTTMPSTVPARLGFLFAAACIVYMAAGAWSRVYERPTPTWLTKAAPLTLLLAGLGTFFTVVLFFDPWTGALWMVFTFMIAIAIVARLRLSGATNRAARVTEHRFILLFLAAFSWWGALQGFGPAIGHLVSAPAQEIAPYLGDQARGFRPGFFAYLIGWTPPFIIGAFLLRRFGRRAQAPAN